MKKAILKCVSVVMCMIMLLGSTAAGGNGIFKCLKTFALNASAEFQSVDEAKSINSEPIDYPSFVVEAESVGSNSLTGKSKIRITLKNAGNVALENITVVPYSDQFMVVDGTEQTVDISLLSANSSKSVEINVMLSFRARCLSIIQLLLLC